MIKITSSKDKALVLECLKAAFEGPFFPDCEFGTINGGERSDVENIINRWDSIDNIEGKTEWIINNILNNFLGYPHHVDMETRNKFITISDDEIAALFKRIKPDLGKSYFDNLM